MAFKKFRAFLAALPPLSLPASYLLIACLTIHLFFDLSLLLLLAAEIMPKEIFLLRFSDTWESQWAALAISVGGVLLYDCEIKKGRK